MTFWSNLEGDDLEARLKLLIDEWSYQKEINGYYRVSVVRMSRHGCRLRSVVVCYDPNVSHGLNINLTMCL